LRRDLTVVLGLAWGVVVWLVMLHHRGGFPALPASWPPRWGEPGPRDRWPRLKKEHGSTASFSINSSEFVVSASSMSLRYLIRACPEAMQWADHLRRIR
jgi:hypothetical protein